jgi:glycosyltransferase involved in cell wall biosynthesis
MAARISVLMPCFNHGDYIEEAIASVLNQTVGDAEIIVVDDGSTEPGTIDRLRTLDLPRTRVLHTPNQGLPAARNHAARYAQGSVFCALDADDRLAPEWFEKALAALDRDPQLAFVSHWLETFGDEQWVWTPSSCELPALLARNTVNGAALVRREAFEAVNGYDQTMRGGCEDWDFWLRLVERGFRGAIVPEILFYYRRTAASMSRTMIAEHAYREPLTTLVRKHESSYRAHLVDVLVAKEAEALPMLKQIADIERDRACVLDPSLRRAAEELAAIEAKVRRVRPDVERETERQRLAAEAAELRREVTALHNSWSWRLTAPLRRLYDVFARKPSAR